MLLKQRIVLLLLGLLGLVPVPAAWAQGSENGRWDVGVAVSTGSRGRILPCT
jgi:hypothetical protein